MLKDGAIVDVVDCRGRGCVTLGRTPDNDVVLEHPSSSRFHAAIQFARGGSEAFVFDNASTHGTFVNKRRLKARVHAPVFVGDQIRFGQSSRIFVVAGASELMPEEGLSRDERRRLRALEKMSEAERTRSSGSSGAHGLDASSRDARGGGDWGMDDEDDRPSESALKLAALDWRDHVGALSEKQEKQKEKIRRKEEKARALRTESERISAKESESTPLTQGQRVTLARNESALEKLEEEIEDADEALNESIRASLGGAAAKTRGARARRDVAGSDSEDARGSDSDDDFYDRTASATARRQKKEQRRKQAREGNRRGRGLNESEDVPVAVETAATLWEKKSVVAAALEASKATLAEAEARKAARSNRALPSGGVEGDVPGDVPETRGALNGNETGNDGEAHDDLDAFMVSVARARDEEATADATKRVAEKEAELARLDRLLRLADPRGEFAPGSDMQRSVERLAEEARARSPRTSRARGAGSRPRRRLRRRARRRRGGARAPRRVGKARRAHRQARVCRERSCGANGGGVAAVAAAAGRRSADQASAAANAALPVGVSTAQERKTLFEKAAAGGESAVPANRSVPASARSIDGGSSGVPPAFFKDDVGFLAPEQLRAAHLGGSGGSAGLEIRAPKRRKGDNAARGSVAAAAEARVADDVRRLLGGGGGFDAGDGDGDGDGDGADATGFTVPQGQSGDGRTSLNDKLGY